MKICAIVLGIPSLIMLIVCLVCMILCPWVYKIGFLIEAVVFGMLLWLFREFYREG